MKVIYNSLIPVKGFRAIMLFGVIFVRKEFKPIDDTATIRHEEIHLAQAKELFWIGFYVLYLWQWIKSGFIYHKILFEIEAYKNQNYPNYLTTRKKFAWKNYK